MADDLRTVVYAIHPGKRARKVGLQNIVFSLFILAILIAACLVGLLSVAVAVIA